MKFYPVTLTDVFLWLYMLISFGNIIRTQSLFYVYIDGLFKCQNEKVIFVGIMMIL